MVTHPDEVFHALGFTDGAHFAVFVSLAYITLSIGRVLVRECRAAFTDHPHDGDSQ